VLVRAEQTAAAVLLQVMVALLLLLLLEWLQMELCEQTVQRQNLHQQQATAHSNAFNIARIN
jgi:cytochrome c-type biogenesis protein CcmH/NrfG